MSARRILYVQRAKGGGSATSLLDLVGALDRDRYTPIVLFYTENRYCDLFRDAGAEVLTLSDRPVTTPVPEPVKSAAAGLQRLRSVREVNLLVRTELPQARRIAGVIASTGADLVHHNNNVRSDRASILAASMARVPQVCHVRFFHDYFRPIDRFAAGLLDGFIYVSRAIEDDFRGQLGVPRDRGRVVHEGFDFDAVSAPAADVRAARDELTGGTGDPLIVNVGRLSPWKGQDVFLRAFAEARRRLPAARAAVVGAARDNEAGRAYESGLRRLVADLGIEDSVTFAGFRSDVAAIMAAADLCVHSSSEPEPFGRVIVEAMAAARPVVATAGGGVLDIVDDGRTGRLVPMGDHGAMADAIADILSDPEAAARMGRAARDDVRERFAVARHADAVREVYDGILGQPGENAPDPVALAGSNAHSSQRT